MPAIRDSMTGMVGRGFRLLVAAAAVLAATGCGPGADDGDPTASEPTQQTEQAPSASESATDHATTHGNGKTPKPRPLRQGEDRVTLTMDAPYTPSPPTGVGTDDYRCFLLDPKLAKDSYLTGTNVLPGNPDVVHHVILFKVPPQDVAKAEALDAAEDDEGWTCFGGPGIDDFSNVDDAPWLGAWAPGGRESVHRPGYGVSLAKGSQIVMQVHYNLLAGAEEDVSSTQLRLAPAAADLTSLHTMLLPGPVELPCRPAHDDGPLCEREAAVADLKERVGGRAGATADLLYFLCGGGPKAGNVQSCTRTLAEPMTIMGVAGHMHLLGRQIKIEVNPGTDRAQTVLDIPVWDFDDQGSRPIEPGAARTPSTRSRSPASTSSGCATSCRPSRASPTATSSGARARPTRCAWACSRSPAPEGPSGVTRWAPGRSSRSMDGLTTPTGRAARTGIHD